MQDLPTSRDKVKVLAEGAAGDGSQACSEVAFCPIRGHLQYPRRAVEPELDWVRGRIIGAARPAEAAVIERMIGAADPVDPKMVGPRGWKGRWYAPHLKARWAVEVGDRRRPIAVTTTMNGTTTVMMSTVWSIRETTILQ